MQKLILISVRDAKGEAYGPIGAAKTRGQAERDFYQLVNTPDTMPNKHPEDFDLWELGYFNDTTGKIDAHETPVHLIKGVQIKKQHAEGLN